MNPVFEKRISDLQNRDCTQLLNGGYRGIERECLRINQEGLIAGTPHPSALGSALTNKFVTTDYSEALIEFVTAPQRSTWEVTQSLFNLHQFAYQHIGDEMFWPFSMPCGLTVESDIAIARYGSSNVGKMKTLYRRGLGERYGRFMQVISGLHFNYSLPETFWPVFQEAEGDTGSPDEFRSASYMGMVRNLHRYDWLLLYLFGASPAVCSSFLKDVEHDLQALGSGTAYSPFATSLRMSGLGYQNSSQAALHVSCNSLDEYVRDLSLAVETPSPDWQKLGVERDGERIQLNTNMLQIENEFYSGVRPKRVAHSGERPTSALQRGGVEYVELRVLDVSPFDPIGINQAEIRFIETFMLFCLLQESPAIGTAEEAAIKRNHADVAAAGRKPGLAIIREGSEKNMQQWAQEILEQMRPVAELLDCGLGDQYQQALNIQEAVAANAELTPSARLLDELRDSKTSFAEYGRTLAEQNKQYFAAQAPEHNSQQQVLEQEAIESVQRQAAVEQSDTLSFDEYISRYYS